MEELHLSKTFLKTAGGRMHTPQPYPSGSAPCHKLQKPSNESGKFSHLLTILILFSFIKRQSQKGEGVWHNVPPPKIRF